MLTLVEKIVFILLALGSLYYGGTRFHAVYRAIMRGKAELASTIWPSVFSGRSGSF